MQGKVYTLLLLLLIVFTTSPIQAQDPPQLIPENGSSSPTPDIEESDDDFSWQPAQDRLYVVTNTMIDSNPSFVFMTDNDEKLSEFQAWYNDKDDGACTSAHAVTWDIADDKKYTFEYTSGTTYYLELQEFGLNYDATESFQQSDNDYAYTCYTVKARFHYGTQILGIPYRTTNSFVVKVYNNVATPPFIDDGVGDTTLAIDNPTLPHSFTTGDSYSVEYTATHAAGESTEDVGFHRWYTQNYDGDYYQIPFAYTPVEDWTSGIATTLDLGSWLTYESGYSSQDDSDYEYTEYKVLGNFKLTGFDQQYTSPLTVKVYSDTITEQPPTEEDLIQPDENAFYTYTQGFSPSSNPVYTYSTPDSPKPSEFQAFYNNNDDGACTSAHTVVFGSGEEASIEFTWTSGTDYELDLATWVKYDPDNSDQDADSDYAHSCYTVLGHFRTPITSKNLLGWEETDSIHVKVYSDTITVVSEHQDNGVGGKDVSIVTQPYTNEQFYFTEGDPMETIFMVTHAADRTPYESVYEAWYNTADDSACTEVDSGIVDATLPITTWVSNVDMTLDLANWLHFDNSHSDVEGTNFPHTCYTVQATFKVSYFEKEESNKFLVKITADKEPDSIITDLLPFPYLPAIGAIFIAALMRKNSLEKYHQ